MRIEDNTIDQKIRAPKISDNKYIKQGERTKHIINDLDNVDNLISNVKLLLRPSNTLNEHASNINIPCLRFSKIIKCCIAENDKIITT